MVVTVLSDSIGSSDSSDSGDCSQSSDTSDSSDCRNMCHNVSHVRCQVSYVDCVALTTFYLKLSC